MFGKVSKELRKEIKEHHAFHKDKKVGVVGIVKNKSDYKMALVHCTDEGGNRISVLDDFTWNSSRGTWDITDDRWCPTEEEDEMIKSFEAEMFWAEEIDETDTTYEVERLA